MRDIGGISFTYKKPTRETRFIKMMEQERLFRKGYYRRELVYNFKKKIRFRRKKRIKEKFLLPRFLKHFYLILKLDDLRKIQKKATRKHGYFEPLFLTMLECRLFMIVFRLHGITNIFMIKSMISNNMFTINGILKNNSNFVSKVGDIISISMYFRELVRYDLIMRYKRKIIFGNTPGFMYVNNKLMLSIFGRPPAYKDLEFVTKKVDIFLGSEYYFPSPS